MRPILKALYYAYPLLAVSQSVSSNHGSSAQLTHEATPINGESSLPPRASEKASVRAGLDFSSVVNETYTDDNYSPPSVIEKETSSRSDAVRLDHSGRMLGPNCDVNDNAAQCRDPSPLPSLPPSPAPTSLPTSTTWSPTLTPTVNTGPRPGTTQSLLKNSATGSVPLTVTGQTGTTVDLFRVYDDTSVVFNVDSSGQSFTNGGTVSSASDRRLKHNITDIDGALGKVLQMRGVEYNYNETLLPHTKGKRDMGFVAQEVKEVEPLLVKQPASGDMEKYLHVEYAKVTPLLVEAVKDMHAEFFDTRLESMKAEVAALDTHYAEGRAKRETEINELRKMVERLLAE